ncbi:MAG: molybdopterin molybdotransferase MoeA [Solirubrobacteraceae bacterium]
MHRTPKPIPLERAQAIVAAAVRSALAAEPVAIDDALGRVLAEPVAAAADVPSFTNSAMDGFAVHAGAAGRTLRIVGEARAGSPAAVGVDPETAVRISTGAALPAGAQAVIQLEACAEDSASQVLVREAVRSERNVRPAGEDMRAGEVVLQPGTTLGAAELAVAVGAGRASLLCAQRPRVAILTTGDELRAPGEPLLPGQIHNSNAAALNGLARAAGAKISGVAHVGDDLDATREAISELLGGADLLIATGGVSVGPHDHVKPALEQLGASEAFWGVSVRPGKPTWFGEASGVLVFGLPGNPRSTMVIFALLVRPALAALQGARESAPDVIPALLADPVQRDPARTDALGVKLERATDGRLWAHPTAGQRSNLTSSLTGADALALIEPGDGTAAAGTCVGVLALR